MYASKSQHRPGKTGEAGGAADVADGQHCRVTQQLERRTDCQRHGCFSSSSGSLLSRVLSSLPSSPPAPSSLLPLSRSLSLSLLFLSSSTMSFFSSSSSSSSSSSYAASTLPLAAWFSAPSKASVDVAWTPLHDFLRRAYGADPDEHAEAFQTLHARRQVCDGLAARERERRAEEGRDALRTKERGRL